MSNFNKGYIDARPLKFHKQIKLYVFGLKTSSTQD